MWRDGLEAIIDSLLDSANMVLAEVKLAEASLFATTPSFSLGHSLHCLDHTGCKVARSVGGDGPLRFACLFHRQNGGFLRIPRTTPLEKLPLKMDKSSALAIGPSALRKVGGMLSGPSAPLLPMACMVVSGSWMVTGEQQDSAAVGSCSAFIRWRA